MLPLNMKNKVIVPFLFLITIILLGACNSNTSTPDAVAMAKKGMVPIEGSTFKTDNGWGYAITVNNKLFIKQSAIPVIEGNKGFASEQDAAKVAQLVINKLVKHESPTIKKDELKQLGVIQ